MNTVTEEVRPDRMVSGRPARRRGRKVLLRAALAVALVVVLLFAVAAVAGARDFELWGWSPKWTREELRFETEGPGVQDNKDIPTALAALGVDEPLYPSWLPEDMVRVDTDIQFDPVLLYEAYHGNDRDLLITIVPSSLSDTAVYQRSESKPNEHIVGNTIHYIFHDVEQVSVVWYTENYTVLIVGDISDDEMKRIIDSVYEVS